MKRASLSKSMRFEVFKRDAFTCQYCGRKAPDVVLEADHIHPVAKGGTNDLLNLITACKDCNSGKSHRQLDDGSVIEKQHKQLADLQERKEQIEMMFQWQKGLLELDSHVLDQLSEFWSDLVSYDLTESGRQSLKKLLKKHSIDEIMVGMKTSVGQYVEFEGDEATPASVEKAWKYVGKICFVSKAEQEKPYLRDLLYIRGILRNRLRYTDDRVALQLLERAYLLDATVESMREFSKEAKNWTEWRNGMEAFIEKQTNASRIPPVGEASQSRYEEENIEEQDAFVDYEVNMAEMPPQASVPTSVDNISEALNRDTAPKPVTTLNREQRRALQKKQAGRKKRF